MTTSHSVQTPSATKAGKLPFPAAASRLGRVVTAMVCVFLAFCTGVGPIYRAQGSIRDFSLVNALIMVISFLVYYGLVAAFGSLIWRREHRLLPLVAEPTTRIRQTTADLATSHDQPATHDRPADKSDSSRLTARATISCLLGRLPRFPRLRTLLLRASSSRGRLFLLFLIAWAWVPVLLNASFGADLLSQTTEIHNWLTHLSGGYVPYHSAAFTQTDIYPIARYLWPVDPTFLTDQHNILLTLFYGLSMNTSQRCFSTMVPAVILLGLLQYLFAAFCCAATAERFFRLRRQRGQGHGTLLLTLTVLILSPMISLATISLTKSPLFSFASLWWLGLLFEALYTQAGKNSGSTTTRTTFPRSAWLELTLASLVMLLSVKYGTEIIGIQAVILLLAARRHWRLWASALLLPLLVFNGAITLAGHSDLIMEGDAIESKGIQVQQIARVARYAPQLIPAEARRQLEPIFNLENMGQVYKPTDADPVKSSGGQGKLTSYRWMTVTAADWKHFNAAWLAIGKAAPVEYADAFIAEFYGYFDVTDQPYVPLLYYSDNGFVAGVFSSHYTNFPPRAALLGFLRGWSALPVLGWPFHGNFYVVLTLLLMCAELRNRRYRCLLWQVPLLTQMAVMVASPADNFDRHMIGVALAAAFVLYSALTSANSGSSDQHLADN